MVTVPTSSAGRIATAIAFVLPVAFNPWGAASYWAPKAALLAVAGAAGLPALVRLTRTGARREASAGVAFLAVAAVATLVSPDRLGSLLGVYNWGTGLIFLAACAGVWAIGAAVPEDERHVVVTALLVGIGISSVVGVLQALDLVRAHILDSGTRAWGLSGDSGRLASLATGVTAIGARGARSRPAWIAAAAGGALVAQVTGTRGALVFVLLFAIVGAAWCPRVRGLMLIAVTVVGVVLGSVASGIGGNSTAVARSSDSGASTLDVRLEVWASARHAVARRPIVGSGPGRFRAATSADRTLREAQIEGSDVLYTDAHNIAIEQLVTTGVLGVGSLLLWLALAFRRATGPLAWFAGGLLAMNLVQPMDPGTTPLLFLALGAAASVPVRPRIAPSLVTAAIAMVAATALIVGDVQLDRAIERNDLALARSSNTLLRPWPQP